MRSASAFWAIFGLNQNSAGECLLDGGKLLERLVSLIGFSCRHCRLPLSMK